LLSLLAAFTLKHTPRAFLRWCLLCKHSMSLAYCKHFVRWKSAEIDAIALFQCFLITGNNSTQSVAILYMSAFSVWLNKMHLHY